MNRLKYIWPVALSVLFYRCDTIEGPYIEDATALVSTVSLFEFTGINCVYCPEQGHEKVEQYIETYGNKLQTIAIHGNEFGDPINGFKLRTAEGQALAVLTETEGLPKGCVNQLGAGGSKAPSALGDDIAKFGRQTPDLELNVDFSVIDSIAKVTITGQFKPSLTRSYGNVFLAVYLVQDKIIGPQKDIRGNHTNYVHRHTFRKSFNGILGDLLVPNPENGTIIESQTFTLNLNQSNIINDSDKAFEDLDLSAFVYVYENSDLRQAVPIELND